MKERRTSFRRRTLLGGQIEIAKLNGWTADCTIRNVSEAGAKIELPPDVVVPTHFEIRVGGEAAQPVRLVWYRSGMAGVELAEA